MSVQVVTVDTTLTASSPSTTIAKLIENDDLTITLPDASAAVGQSFTVSRDGTGGRSWEWLNTGITALLNDPGSFNGAVTPDEAHYFVPYSTFAGSILYKYNTSTWAQEASVTMPLSTGEITDMIVSSDGTKLFLAVNASPAVILVYSTSSLSLLQTITLSSDTSTGSLALSGTTLYCATSRGVVTIDTGTYAVALLVSQTGSSNNLCISPSYIFLGYFAGSPDYINVYNISTGAFVQAINYGAFGINQFAYDPSGERVWCNGNGSVLLIIDAVALTVLYSKAYNNLSTAGSRIVLDTTNNLAYIGSTECLHVFDSTLPGGSPTLVTSLKCPGLSTAWGSQPLARVMLGTNVLVQNATVAAPYQWYVVNSSRTIGDNIVNVATQSGQLINGSSAVSLLSPDDARTVVAYYDNVSSVYAWSSLSSLVTVSQDANVAKLPKFQQQDFANELMVVQLTDGTLVGWGDNTGGALCNGQTAGVSPPAPVLYDPWYSPDPEATIVDWALTSTNLFVVFSDGSVYAGGQNAAGQLGDGTTTAKIYLKHVAGLPNTVNRVWASSGAAGNSGIVFYGTSDNKLYACGLNTQGELGVGSITNVTTPMLSWNSGAFNDVIIGQDNGGYWSFLVTASGGLHCTGYNAQGQLGLGNTTQQTSWQTVTISGAGNILKVATTGGYNGTTRYSNSMVVDSSGNVYVTGSNAEGQLSQGTATASNSFVKVILSSPYTVGTPFFVKAGFGNGQYPTCWALTDVGSFWTWGYGGGNALFQSSTGNFLNATRVFLGPQVLEVRSPMMNTNENSSQTIILCSDGALKYSGNSNGFFGIADPNFSSGVYNIPTIPQMPFPQNEIVDMFMHGTINTQRLCVLTKKGKIFALGNNTNAIVTGGVAYSTTNTAEMWYQVPLGRYQR